MSHSAVGDKSQVQDTGSGVGGSGSVVGSSDSVTETRIKPRSR